MSINPCITHSSPNQSLYAPFGVTNGTIPFNSILVTNGNITASYPGGAGQTMTNAGGDVTFAQVAVNGTGIPQIFQTVVNGGVNVSAGSIETTANQMTMGFAVGAAPPVAQGLIVITDNIGGGNGGVGLQGEDLSSLSVGNGAVTVGGNADLVAPTVNGRTLGKVAEWLDRNAPPLTQAGIDNATPWTAQSFTTLTLNNFYRVTAFVAVTAGAGVVAADALTFAMSAGGEGLVDLMTITGGITPATETWTGTISAIVQETSAGDPLNLVVSASSAATWDVTIYSGQIENLGTVLTGVPNPF